jgi:hypothetical protein
MQGREHQKRGNLITKQVAMILENSRYALHTKMIEKILKSNRGKLIKFSELKEQKEEAVEKIVKYLKLKRQPSLLKDKFSANSSYKDREKDIKINGLEQFFVCRLFLSLVNFFPIIAIFILKVREVMRSQGCPLFWRLTKVNYFRDEFKRELIKKGDFALYKKIFGNEKKFKK